MPDKKKWTKPMLRRLEPTQEIIDLFEGQAANANGDYRPPYQAESCSVTRLPRKIAKR
jgi:hypothetical protein